MRATSGSPPSVDNSMTTSPSGGAHASCSRKLLYIAYIEAQEALRLGLISAVL